jgi:hypothetical protein
MLRADAVQFATEILLERLRGPDRPGRREHHHVLRHPVTDTVALQPAPDLRQASRDLPVIALPGVRAGRLEVRVTALQVLKAARRPLNVVQRLEDRHHAAPVMDVDDVAVPVAQELVAPVGRHLPGLAEQVLGGGPLPVRALPDDRRVQRLRDRRPDRRADLREAATNTRRADLAARARERPGRPADRAEPRREVQGRQHRMLPELLHRRVRIAVQDKLARRRMGDALHHP